MTPSLNEIEMTVWKAARGAGLAWGLAEEMGQAARWLADHGFDWAPPLVAALADAERAQGRPPIPGEVDGVWQPAGAAGVCSAILCGPLLCDVAMSIGGTRPVLFDRVAHPLLLLPFAARAAADFGMSLTLRIDAAEFYFDPPAVAGTSRLEGIVQAEAVTLSMDGRPGSGPMSAFDAGAPRRPIPAPLADLLEAWVQRTYVPASAESRIAGAGAGLTDND